jgi:hypothetical protein
MQFAYSSHFLQNYSKAPVSVQRAFDKQSALLFTSLRHPSLKAKKYAGADNLWQARVNRDWRFSFTSERDTYCLQEIKAHPK